MRAKKIFQHPLMLLAGLLVTLTGIFTLLLASDRLLIGLGALLAGMLIIRVQQPRNRQDY